jgi:hypothetical protein
MQRAACFIVILFASLSAHHANSAPGAPIRERGHGPAVRPAAAPPHVTTPRHVGTTVGQHWGQPAHPVNNPSHQVYVHNSITNRDEPHRMIVDHRPAYVIDHDPRLRVVVRGYHPVHDWGYWHPGGGWFHLWGITAWDHVGTVTCEAANEETGEMFPVSEDRDAAGWDDGAVNAALDQALDDCMAEAGSATCAPATPSCTFQGN